MSQDMTCTNNDTTCISKTFNDIKNLLGENKRIFTDIFNPIQFDSLKIKIDTITEYTAIIPENIDKHIFKYFFTSINDESSNLPKVYINPINTTNNKESKIFTVSNIFNIIPYIVFNLHSIYIQDKNTNIMPISFINALYNNTFIFTTNSYLSDLEMFKIVLLILANKNVYITLDLYQKIKEHIKLYSETRPIKVYSSKGVLKPYSYDNNPIYDKKFNKYNDCGISLTEIPL